MFNKLSDQYKNYVVNFINGNGKKSILSKNYHIKHRYNHSIIVRIRDILCSIVALLIFFPVYLIISLKILLDSGFPIHFKQKRIGKNGKLFKIYKFRTMKKNAEEILKNDKELYEKYVENNFKLKLEDDPRIIKFGKKLRKTSLDEIPQFVNVLKGEMTLVGPRPIVPDEMERYGEHAKEFVSAKPGITGLWQTTGRSEIDYPDRKYLDIIYIRNKTFLLDIKIILKTFKAVFRKIGAH